MQTYHIALKTNHGGPSTHLQWSIITANSLTDALSQWRKWLGKYADPYACYPVA